jgi:hypothetical protein
MRVYTWQSPRKKNCWALGSIAATYDLSVRAKPKKYILKKKKKAKEESTACKREGSKFWNATASAWAFGARNAKEFLSHFAASASCRFRKEKRQGKQMSDSEGGNLNFFSGRKMRLREEGRREGFADGSSLYFVFNSFYLIH